MRSVERVTLRELCERYITARPRLTKSYKSHLRRVAKGIEWTLERTAYADELNQATIDDFLAAERTRMAEATVTAFATVATSLWGEAWSLGLNQFKNSESTHWIEEEDGYRYIARGSQVIQLAGGGRKAGGPKNCPPGSLRHLLREIYAPRKLRGKSVHAIRLHENTITNFEKYLDRTAMLTDLDDDLATQFLGWLRALPRTAETVNNNRSRLVALWNFAARKRLVESFPDVEPEVVPKRAPRGWRSDELPRLFAAVASTRGKVDRIPAGKWWLLLHLLMWDTGERIGAIMASRFDWFDPSTNVLAVPAEARKGRREDRRYPLHTETVKLLEEVRKPEREIILPWPWCQGTLYNRYDAIVKRAGLPTGRKFRFHCLRKSVASHGAVMGLDPKGLMGHIDGKITARYLDPAIVGQAPSGSALFRPMLTS